MTQYYEVSVRCDGDGVKPVSTPTDRVPDESKSFLHDFRAFSPEVSIIEPLFELYEKCTEALHYHGCNPEAILALIHAFSRLIAVVEEREEKAYNCPKCHGPRPILPLRETPSVGITANDMRARLNEQEPSP